MSAKRIVVAMSGGVDSSTAAFLLKQEGWEPVGVHLRLWPGGGPGGEKFSRNARDAAAVAERIGIPFHVVEFQERFLEEIVSPFVEEYRRGRTPNPCVRCNPAIKLGLLLEWARSQGAQAVATGHYARIVHNAATQRWELRRSADANKDQTYYLHRLSQEQLAAFRTPLGGMIKDAVRRLARANDLPVAEKSESQEICFITNNDYRGFLEAWPGHAQDLSGLIVDTTGRVLGRHEGIHRFTIGQRRGIGVSAPRPLYVIEIRASERVVVVGQEEDLDAVELETGTVVWGAIPGLDGPRRARVKIRYRSPAAPAEIAPLDAGGVRVCFDAPQRAITPGQSAVFYDEADEMVLGGGIIEKAVPRPRD